MSLSTWEALEIRKGDARLVTTAMPGRHGPAVLAALLPSVMGTMLDFATQGAQPHYRMYISGDTLLFGGIALIPHRFPDIDLVLLHLGGTRVFKMIKLTMDGKDGGQMQGIIAPRRAIPIHFNDYGGFKSPLEDFQREVHAAGLATSITYLKQPQTRRDLPLRRLAGQIKIIISVLEIIILHSKISLSNLYSIGKFPLISAVDACQIVYCLVH